MIPLIGYAPDANPTTAGVLVDCAGYIPSTKGMKSAPSAVTGALSPALAAACVGAAALRKLDNSTRFFAGTTAALYEAGASTWTNVTRSTGAYSLGAESRWRFAQFGNVSLATAKTEVIQFSLNTGTFGNIGSVSLKAGIIETAGDYIIACNTNEAAYGDCTNRWWVTPTYTDWTPSISNLIATGIITSSPGPITACRRFGNGVAIYKERSMFVGTFTGPPTVFSVAESPGEAGAPSQESVVVIGTQADPKHIFMGYDDFYIFDGGRATPIGTPVRETVFNDLNRPYAYKCTANHDRVNSRVFFYYPSNSGGGALDRCVVYNYLTNKWGRDDRTIEAAADYISAGYTYADYGTLFSTYGTNVSVSYGSPFWTSSSQVPAIFNTSHVVQTLTGASGTCSYTLGDIGDEIEYSMIRRVQPRFLNKPTSATCTNFYRNELDETLTQDAVTSMSSGRFDMLREARWHRIKIETSGDAEVSDMRIDFEKGGQE